jgi:DhnA family fructose-bisphosphate aldolase class Ia
MLKFTAATLQESLHGTLLLSTGSACNTSTRSSIKLACIKMALKNITDNTSAYTSSIVKWGPEITILSEHRGITYQLNTMVRIMDSKTYRLREFINPASGRSLIVDTSAGLALGTLPGLEQFGEAVGPVLPLVDGLVTSPGQARKLAGRTRADGALLVRADWTNALRNADFVLPPETINHLPLLAPQAAMDLGASASVIHFLLGHEEQIEADCLRLTVQLAVEGSKIGMPLIVDVQPLGPRVVLRAKAIELGVSYALEGGADGVAVPWPDAKSFETILTMAAEVPIWVKPSSLNAEAELQEALSLGAAGLWLGAEVFGVSSPVEALQKLRAMVHATQAAGA